MNNPEALLFTNEVVRPLAEQLRALSVRLGSIRTQWYGGMNLHFANASDPVEDGRENEGISRLICGDVTNLIAQALITAPGEANAWNPEIIQKPCVRQLEVE